MPLERELIATLRHLFGLATTIVILLTQVSGLHAQETDSQPAAPPRIIHPDQPTEIEFAAKPARYVRLLIHATNGAQPCIDELEIYGPAADINLAESTGGAKPTASSCLRGYAKHTIAHLNDGRYGNDFSWIAARRGDEWAQIEMPETALVSRVVFSRDRSA